MLSTFNELTSYYKKIITYFVYHLDISIRYVFVF